MLKETGYQKKIEMLAPWLEEIIEIVKKDLRNEHLKMDRSFCKKYFLGKNPNHVSVKEMTEAYRLDIQRGNVGLGEFIATRWLLRHTDIYGFFEERLKNFKADFETLEELPLDFSNALISEAIETWSAKATYCFAVLNSVVFPAECYHRLMNLATEERVIDQEEQQSLKERETVEQMKERHRREITALNERFEKKFSGMHKKYLQDVETLKKQIRTLHKRVAVAEQLPPGHSDE